MFHYLDFWKNEFAAKQDQKPVSVKTEFFGEKGSVVIGEEKSWNENFWMVTSLPLHELLRFYSFLMIPRMLRRAIKRFSTSRYNARVAETCSSVP